MVASFTLVTYLPHMESSVQGIPVMVCTGEVSSTQWPSSEVCIRIAGNGISSAVAYIGSASVDHSNITASRIPNAFLAACEKEPVSTKVAKSGSGWIKS